MELTESAELMGNTPAIPSEIYQVDYAKQITDLKELVKSLPPIKQ